MVPELLGVVREPEVGMSMQGGGMVRKMRRYGGEEVGVDDTHAHTHCFP